MGFTGTQQAGPAVKIHVTTSFSRDIAALQNALGRDADSILDLLIDCLQRLKRYKWDKTLPIEEYGIYGDSYSYAFCKDYRFTFKNITDRDEQKAPLVEHYHLKNMLRGR